MRGLDFFREAARLANELRRPAQIIQQVFQTNGTLLDDEWGEFLAQENALVGVSIDGPAWLHDKYRVNKAGRGTHAQVVRGWEVLQRHNVDANILCTVNSVNAAHPREVYEHFRDDLGGRHFQFIPIVERVASGEEAIAEASWRAQDGSYVLYRQEGSGTTSRTVAPVQYGEFLVAIFDEWVQRDVGTVFVQDFDVMLGAVFGQYSLCVRAPECGTALAMEHNGDIYSCDHYVEPGYKIGNLGDMSFAEALELPTQREFGRSKRTALPSQCLQCPVRWACHGGCPKDRFVSTAAGEPGLNFLCPGYFHFFTHATPTILTMAQLLAAGRPASDIMGRGKP